MNLLRGGGVNDQIKALPLWIYIMDKKFYPILIRITLYFMFFSN